MPPFQTPAPELGAKAPDFKLKGVDGKTYALADVAGRNGTVVMFICNHCPYVKAVAPRLVGAAEKLRENGIGVIAINANDTVSHPADSFENMQKFSAAQGFTFPYVIDETQNVAKAYGAVCTPDFFGYNAALELQYRGRLDEVNPSRPATASTRRELVEAMLDIARSGKGPAEQHPAMGCGIKWKAAA